MPVNTQKEKYNPCLKEQNMVYKCLNESNYNPDMCQKHFHNYQNCKDFWGKVQSDRRRKGIKPTLPPESERLQIKEEYLRNKVK